MPVMGCSYSAAYKDMMFKKYKQVGMQFSDRVEEIVRKGEIARYEKFLLFPQCFQKLFDVDESKLVSVE